MPRRDRERDEPRNPLEDIQVLFRQWAQANVQVQQHNSEMLQQLSQQNLAARQTRDERSVIPKFDGSRSWAVFLAQFESATAGWTAEAKGRRLLQCLEGRAADVVQTLPAAQYTDYERLRERLQQHYNPCQRAALAEAELDRRVQKTNESLSDFGADVLQLARVAYPTWQEEALQTYAKKVFLAGIADPDVARIVRHQSHASFAEALTASIQADNVERMFPPGKRPRLNQVSAGAPNANEASTSTASDDVRVAAVRSADADTESQKLLGQLKALVEGLGKDAPSTSGASGSGASRKGCYSCGSPTHFYRECPRRRRNERDHGRGRSRDRRDDRRRDDRRRDDRGRDDRRPKGNGQ